MAAVKTYTDKVRGARYGKDVRSSIADAIDKINEESETSVKRVNQAEANINKAISDAATATGAANSAASAATTAAINASEAAQAVFDEKYILTARTEFAKSTDVSPTARGNAILEKLRGDSWQDTSIGKNLWSHGDISFVTSDYKSINITSGTYMVSALVTTGSPDNTSVIVFHGVSGATIRVPFIANTNGRVSNKVVLNESITGVSFYSMGDGGTSGDSATWSDIQIEVGEVETEFEEYFGTSPSPNKPQIIHSVGDTGWFGGEWLQGVLNETTGAWSNNDYRVYSPSYIPCKEGDIINIVCEIPRPIRLAYYDKDKLYISSAIYTDNTIVPGNVAYFRMSVLSELNVSKITPSTAGHVCVTINGKYAAQIKQVGKNLFDISKALLGEFKSDGDYAFVNSERLFYDFDWKENTQYAFSGYTKNDASAGNVRFAVHYTDGTVDVDVLRNTSTEYKYVTYISRPNKTISRMTATYGNSGYMYIRRGELQIEEGSVATPYTPHQSTHHYIPLDEPLRGIGDVRDEIVCQNGVYGVLRRVGEFVLRNITDIAHTGTSGTARCIISIPDKIYKETGAILCDRAVSGNDKAHCFWENPANIILRGDVSDDLETFKAKYEGTVFVYQLAEPVFTPFADQTPFYNFESYDEVTHVSIVGHEELEPMATIRFPRNEDGALETTNHCEKQLLKIENKAIRAEIEELTAALLALGRE